MTLRSLINDLMSYPNADLDSQIIMLDQNGVPHSPAIFTTDDLSPGDPAISELQPTAIYITESAE